MNLENQIAVVNNKKSDATNLNLYILLFINEGHR